MKRCFLAIPVADTTRDELLRAQKRLPTMGPGHERALRPVPGRNLHLTLKFFGQLDTSTLETLGQSLEEWLKQMPALPPLSLRSVGAFPAKRGAKAIFADIGGGRDALINLMNGLEERCTNLGLLSDSRPRKPHVTIVRVKERIPPHTLNPWFAEFDGREFGPLIHDEVVLYDSELNDSGSIYSPIRVFTWGASPS